MSVKKHAHKDSEAKHSHGHLASIYGSHGHQHQHVHKNRQAVLNRMSRLIGHLESTKRMVVEGRDCPDILVQLSAVNSAIKGVSRLIIKDHLDHCIVDAVRDNDQEALARLNDAIDKFIK